MKKNTTFFLALLCLICIGKAEGQTQIISTIAGTGHWGYTGDGGSATTAKLDLPFGIAVDDSGKVYIADQDNFRVRMINQNGIIKTIAGNGMNGTSGDGGPATAARLYPTGIALDHIGNIFIADANNNCVRKIDTAGIITRVAGTGAAGFYGDNGPATSATLQYPSAVAVDLAGNVYIADENNNRIRMVNASGIISTVAGGGTGGLGNGGPATAGRLFVPSGIAIDTGGNLLICDQGNNMVRYVSTSGIISTYAGTGSAGYGGDGGPAIAATFNYPNGIAVDDSNNVYIAENNTSVVRKIDGYGIITTFAGNSIAGYSGDGGPSTAAELNNPKAVAVDTSGSVYVADLGNNVIRKLVKGIPPLNMPSVVTLPSIALAPNPNDGTFRISGNIGKVNNDDIFIQVWDLTGREVYVGNTVSDHGYIDKEIKLNNLSDGIYMLSIRSENNSGIVRFVIRK